jgi:hypothetical protein
LRMAEPTLQPNEGGSALGGGFGHPIFSLGSWGWPNRPQTGHGVAQPPLQVFFLKFFFDF